MRKQLLFALPCCAAVSLALTPQVFPDQTQTAKLQTSGQYAQTSARTTQQPTVRHMLPPGMRTLSLREGRAIVQEMAWADDEEGLAPDCSHLVHTLYEHAGYPSPSASSVDLYRGTGNFVRVRAPQPGDLVVWRGHVGIVVNPKEHSFFSSVSEGARIQSYTSAYWQARGYARFFRYVTSSPLKNADKTMEAANRQPEAPPRVQADRSKASDPPSPQPVKTAPATESKLRSDAKAKRARAEEAPASAPAAEDPSQVPLRSGSKQPKAADVNSALEAANLEAGEILRAGDLERLERPVVVYRNLQVSGLEIKGKRGAAQIQIQTLATISADRMESQQGWEDHQLELQRTKKGWVMRPTSQSVYVPRDGAMRILAARLAALTQNVDRSTEKDREQAYIIRFMSLLIE